MPRCTYPRIEYYGKERLVELFQSWKCDQPIPTKAKKVVIVFPPGYMYRQIDVTWSDLKSDEGRRLYKAVFSNPDTDYKPPTEKENEQEADDA